MIGYRSLLDNEIIDYLVSTLNFQKINSFPVDCCSEITRFVFDESLNNNSSLSQISDLGVVVKEVYGILNSSVFHSLIQIGDHILDVSQDALNKDNYPIKITHIDKIDFKQINSYIQMFEIMEKYWGFEIFPNHIIPQVAPILPYLIKYKDNVHFLDFHIKTLLYGEFKSDFSMANDFLFNSSYSEKELPKPLCENLLKSVEKRSEIFYKKKNISLVKELFPKLILSKNDSFKDDYHSIIAQRNSFEDKEHFDKLLYTYTVNIIK
jgi:hypothetical protein